MSRVNLQRLDATALRRYRRFYKLPDVGPNSTKEQLLAAISRHFSQQVCTSLILSRRCLMERYRVLCLMKRRLILRRTALSCGAGRSCIFKLLSCTHDTVFVPDISSLRCDAQAVDENRVIAMFVCSARQQALHGPSHEQ